MDAEKMMMQKRIDNLCEQLEMLKNKLEEEKAHHQHTLECAQQFEKDWLKMKRERDAAIRDIPRACGYCKHYAHKKTHECHSKTPCAKVSGVNTAWEWRGLCKENGGVIDE